MTALRSFPVVIFEETPTVIGAMRFPRNFPILATAAALVALLSSCASFSLYGPRKVDRSSSIVSFLYPDARDPLVTPSVPVLRLPLRVGLAFVPEASNKRREDFSDAQKSALLERIAAQFKNRAFIQSIQVIPSSYLRPGGSFANLDQIRNLLGVDVMVLVAYDQMQFTDANKLSLAYWTIVGAYLIKGNKNDTHTLLEAVVYDIPSRKLLFRAPGVSHVSAGSTAIEIRQRLREDSAKGFELATNDLIKNLKAKLTAFQERLKQSPGEAKIEHRPGYTGVGLLPSWFAAGLLLLGAARWMVRRS